VTRQSFWISAALNCRESAIIAAGPLPSDRLHRRGYWPAAPKCTIVARIASQSDDQSSHSKVLRSSLRRSRNLPSLRRSLLTLRTGVA